MALNTMSLGSVRSELQRLWLRAAAAAKDYKHTLQELKYTFHEIRSVVSATPIVLLFVSTILCFMWWDIQNRFMNQSERIISNQGDLRVAIEALQRTEAGVQNIQDTVSSAQKKGLLIERDADRIDQLLRVSRDTLSRALISHDKIEQTHKAITASAEAVEAARKSSEEAVRKSEESLRQSRLNSTQLSQSTDEIMRNLLINDKLIQQQLEDVRSALQRIVDRKK